jgi:hypothetical protein
LSATTAVATTRITNPLPPLAAIMPIIATDSHPIMIGLAGRRENMAAIKG